MADKVIWDLSDEDFTEIQDLFEKRLALENLINVVDVKNTELHDKVVKDYGETLHKFNDWWPAKKAQYNWDGDNWWLNFDTKQIMCKD